MPGRRENTGKTDFGENRCVGIHEILSASPLFPQRDILSHGRGGRRAGLAQTPLLPLNSSFRHNLVPSCDGFCPGLHRKKGFTPKKLGSAFSWTLPVVLPAPSRSIRDLQACPASPAPLLGCREGSGAGGGGDGVDAEN